MIDSNKEVSSVYGDAFFDKHFIDNVYIDQLYTFGDVNREN